MIFPIRTTLLSLDDVDDSALADGRVLSYDATGNSMVFVDPASGGGSPGGADGSVQFNDAGSFGGFGSWDADTHTLTLAYAGGTEIQLQTTDGAGETAVRFQNVASGKHHYLRQSNGALMIQAEGGGNVRRAIVVTDGGHVAFGNYNRVSTAGATFSPPAANPGAQPIAVRGDGSNDYLVTLHGNGDTQIGGIRADASWDLPELADASAVNDSVYYSTDQSAPAYKDSAGTVHSLIGSGGGSGATNLDGLTDVVITAPATGDYLRHNGTAWVNAPIAADDLPDLSGTYAVTGHNHDGVYAPAGHSHNLGDLDDVAITTPSTGQVLKFNGTTWINDTDDTAAGGGSPGGVDGAIQYNADGSFGGFGAWDADSNVLTIAATGNPGLVLQSTDNQDATIQLNRGSATSYQISNDSGNFFIKAGSGPGVYPNICLAAGSGGVIGVGTSAPNNGQSIRVAINVADRTGLSVLKHASQTANLIETLDGATVTFAVRADSSIKLPQIADATAVNDSVYYSTDQAAPAYKDGTGTVHSLVSTGGGSGASTLDDLTDVAITTPAADHVLQFDGASWINAPLTAAQVGAYSTGDVDTALAAKAPLASPVFTGRATIPAHIGTITTDIDDASGTITFDLAVSDWHRVTLGGNRTLALANAAIGQQFTLLLEQDATGSRTVTWFAGIRWAGGTPPTLTTTAGKADVFTFKCIGTGEYLGFVAGANL